MGIYNEKTGLYTNAYGYPIKCFICGSNLVINSISYPKSFGGYGELLFCEDHKEEVKQEAKKRSEYVSNVNIRASGS